MKPSDFSDIIHNYDILNVGLLSTKKDFFVAKFSIIILHTDSSSSGL